MQMNRLSARWALTWRLIWSPPVTPFPFFFSFRQTSDVKGRTDSIDRGRFSSGNEPTIWPICACFDLKTKEIEVSFDCPVPFQISRCAALQSLWTQYVELAATTETFNVSRKCFNFNKYYFKSELKLNF
jgi:hypothetical protein